MTTAIAERTRIRVAVVDDQRLFTYGMEMLIRSQADFEFVGAANDGAAGVELVRELRPDVVLMDLRMPVMTGIEASAQIAALESADPSGEAGTRVIVLTMFQRDETVLAALRAGASAFVTKDATPDVVLDTIRSVHAGEAIAAPQATFSLIREFASAAPPAHAARIEAVLEQLTPRESEVLLLLARGLSNAEISASAFITEATTKTHVRLIMKKLGLRSRTQAVVFAYENGLIAR